MPRLFLVTCGCFSVLLFSACGGGGSSPPAPAFTVGGTVTGLTGTAVLQINGADDLTINGNGDFTFTTPLTNGSNYNVSVASSPVAIRCRVSNQNGAVNGSNITNIRIDCRAASTNTRLSALALTQATLDQIFQGNQTSYTAGVNYLQRSVRVNASVEDANATLSVNNAPLMPGVDSAAIILDEGANTLAIRVVAEDETSAQTYTIDVVRQPANSFGQQAYLKATNAEAGDSFGAEVALWGDTLVVAAPDEDGDASSTAIRPNNNASNAGAVYVFVRVNGVWSQQAYLKAANAEAGDSFGRLVALWGDTLVVAAISEDGDASSTATNPNNNAPGAGAVYVFVRAGTTWTQQAYLKAPNADSGDAFGTMVAIAGDTLVVGAGREDGDANSSLANPNDNTPDAGAVYVYTRSANTWVPQAYLKANNAGQSDHFGSGFASGSSALSGDTLAVAAFGEDGDVNSTAAAPNDNAQDAGAVYVFTRSGTSWTQQAYLKASNAEAGDMFGTGVALDGDRLVIGASGEDGGAGAAYVFTRNASGWTQNAYLKASNTDSTDRFGADVALSGDTLAIGAYFEAGDASSTDVTPNNNAPRAGAVYIFMQTHTGTWQQARYVKASNAESNDQFGVSVSLNGDSLAVGAWREDGDAGSTLGMPNNNANGAGAMYFFQ